MDTESRKEFRERLLSWLRHQHPRDDADLFFYHLGDLRDALVRAASLIERMPGVADSTDEELRKLLATLSGELLDHIPSHTKEIANGLTAWRDKLYAEAEERGEL